MQFVESDGGRKAAGYKGIAGDCVCRAIAHATGLPYKEVYGKLAHGNMTQRKTKNAHSATGHRTAQEGINTNREWFKRYMRKLGFEWHATMHIGTGCVSKLRSDDPLLPKTGRMVVRVSKHVTAVIDGVLYDTFDCSRDGERCVYGYWLLTRK